MKNVTLPEGQRVPALGLGTWRLGERSSARAAEIAAVRRAVKLGYRLFDTAEMYGDGGAEEVLGEALGDCVAAGEVRRDDVFLVSKVLPSNASRRGAPAACARSLRRLGVDRLDLYLLHWRGSVPLAETVEALQRLVESGQIARWGVSNFDVADMEELWRLDHGPSCAANQVYYSLRQRGIEYDLLPWQRHHKLAAMAYCPIDQGALATNQVLERIGRARGLQAAQVALAWVLRQPEVIAIPKAVSEAHQRANRAAASVELTSAELQELDAAFPPPRRKRPLAMI
jgi:diketogulonate reductase-like aldo/keto reductase